MAASDDRFPDRGKYPGFARTVSVGIVNHRIRRKFKANKKEMEDKMSKEKFTPAPWSIHHFGNRTLIVTGMRKDVCEIYSLVNLGEKCANANLIAAAPEMYEALHTCFITLQIIPTILVTDEELFNAVLEKLKPINKLARQVLKKARGEI